MTMNDWQNAYGDYLRAAGSTERTVEGRVLGARRLLLLAATDDPLTLTTADALRFIASVPAKASRATYYQHVRSFARFLRALGYPVTFSDNLPVIRFPRGLPRPVDGMELAAAILTAPPKAGMMLRLAAYAGLRVSEIARVRGEDVGAAIYVFGKGGRGAMVPTHPAITEAAAGFPSEGLWFPGKDGAVPHAVTVWKHMHEALVAVGSSATPHQVRHYYGCALLEAGVDLRTTQELLRHASLNSTQVYTRVTDERRKAAIAALPTLV